MAALENDDSDGQEHRRSAVRSTGHEETSVDAVTLTGIMQEETVDMDDNNGLQLYRSGVPLDSTAPLPGRGHFLPGVTIVNLEVTMTEAERVEYVELPRPLFRIKTQCDNCKIYFKTNNASQLYCSGARCDSYEGAPPRVSMYFEVTIRDNKYESPVEISCCLGE